MRQKAFAFLVLLASSTILTRGQDCKLKFSVVYNDGKDMQVGMTPDQKKMWDHDAGKKYKGMCLDDKAPEYIILWSRGLNESELVKVGVDRANDVQALANALKWLKKEKKI